MLKALKYCRSRHLTEEAASATTTRGLLLEMLFPSELVQLLAACMETGYFLHTTEAELFPIHNLMDAPPMGHIHNLFCWEVRRI